MNSSPRVTAGTPPGGRSDLDAAVVLKALRKGWPLIVATVVLCAGASLLYWRTQPPVYEAATLLEINPNAAQPLGDKASDVHDMGVGIYWDAQEYYQTEFQIVTSDRVLGSVVRDLSLTTDYGFLGLKAPPPAPASVEVATATLRGRVAVEPVKNSRLFHIKVDDTDPKRARRLADAVANAFIDQNLQTAVNSSIEASSWLGGQVDHVKKVLERDENALHDFKETNDLPSTSINESSNMLRLEMQEYDTALTHTRTRKQELLARHTEFAKITAANPDDLPSSELLASSYLQALRTQYQAAVKDRASLLAEGKGENHPLVKSLTGRVEATATALLTEVHNIQAAVDRDLAIVEHEEAGEEALFEQARSRAVDLSMKEIEYHRLDRSREENEKLFELLSTKMKEADLARMMRGNNIRIVDLAQDPGGPVRPHVAVNVGIGAIAGLILGFAFTFLREQLDNSVKTPQDLEEQLGATFLGLLPELAEDNEKRQRGRRRSTGPFAPAAGSHPELVVHEHPLSGIAEAARSIRTNLMFMNPDRPYKRLLVSSAAPMEGKTTIACSIAIALAQGGQRVCIVDCDLRRPRLHRIFDRVGDSGVTNVLLGECTVDEVAKPTVVQNLWAIPAGPVPPSPADLIHSERFRRFLGELSERFDRVVIDSPPLAAVTDSAVLSTLVDGTVFVVRAFQTSKQLARQGLRALRDVDARVVGAVLNAVNLSKHEYSYYHYYYKGDGYQPLPVTEADGGASGQKAGDRHVTPN
ncbi:MAG TPA: polysaccharide biosynthesis tyrosine autokinase [Polyangiaceae bacterium]